MLRRVPMPPHFWLEATLIIFWSRSTDLSTISLLILDLELCTKLTEDLSSLGQKRCELIMHGNAKLCDPINGKSVKREGWDFGLLRMVYGSPLTGALTSTIKCATLSFCSIMYLNFWELPFAIVIRLRPPAIGFVNMISKTSSYEFGGSFYQ